MSSIYEFADYSERKMEWWMESEEGSLIFRRADDRFDSSLIVDLGMDEEVGQILAHLATEDGPDLVKLRLIDFKHTANAFSMQVGKQTSRTIFLRKFANILPESSRTKPNQSGRGISTTGTTRTPDESSNVLDVRKSKGNDGPTVGTGTNGTEPVDKHAKDGGHKQKNNSTKRAGSGISTTGTTRTPDESSNVRKSKGNDGPTVGTGTNGTEPVDKHAKDGGHKQKDNRNNSTKRAGSGIITTGTTRTPDESSSVRKSKGNDGPTGGTGTNGTEPVDKHAKDGDHKKKDNRNNSTKRSGSGISTTGTTRTPDESSNVRKSKGNDGPTVGTGTNGTEPVDEHAKDGGHKKKDNRNNSTKQTVRSEENECSPESLEKHHIGDNFRVKLSLLVAPGESRAVRPLDVEHAEKLKKDFEKNPDCNFTKMLLHIKQEPHEVDVMELNSGAYTFEVLGGNHTRYALQKSGGGDTCVDAIVYAGLSDAQALCLGLQHNYQHKNAKAVTFTDHVRKFREHWGKQIKDPEAPTREERTSFKDHMARILRVPRKTINHSFRHHLFMITLAPDLWNKAEQLLLMWEKGVILEQLRRPFNQCDAIVLERLDDLGQCLRKLCQKEVSWKQLKTSKTSKAKTDIQTGGTDAGALQKRVKLLEDDNRRLAAENSTLKRKFELASEEVGVMRRKLEDAEQKTDSGKEEEYQEDTWIAVLYGATYYLGQVRGVEGDRVLTQFLTGRVRGRLSDKDTQRVERKYIVAKVGEVTNSNGLFKLLEEETTKLKTAFKVFKEKYM